jgi:hypothetical protein
MLKRLFGSKPSLKKEVIVFNHEPSMEGAIKVILSSDRYSDSVYYIYPDQKHVFRKRKTDDSIFLSFEDIEGRKIEMLYADIDRVSFEEI